MTYISREHQLRVDDKERMKAKKKKKSHLRECRSLRVTSLQCSCEYTVTLAVRLAFCNIRLCDAHSEETEPCIQPGSDES